MNFQEAMKRATKRAVNPDENKETARRLHEILSILRKHQVNEGLTPEKAVAVLQDLGPTFVKIGQIASTHPDMLPAEYCDAFSKLRAHVTPMPIQTVRTQVETELGRPIDEVFSDFDEMALGSASIAQVHKATLRAEGIVVAVKVQRPGIVETVTDDLALMKRAVGLLEMLNTEGERLSVKDLVNELERTSRDELDFTIEAGNLVRFYENNEHRPRVTSPWCYKKYSTRAVLVMDYAQGHRVGDAEELAALSRDERKSLGYLIANNYLAQILKDGFFHADPHAGNILIKRMPTKTAGKGKAKAGAGAAAGAAGAAAKGELASAAAAVKTAAAGAAKVDGTVAGTAARGTAAGAAKAKAGAGAKAASVSSSSQVGIEWIDFGMMGELSSKDRDVLMSCARAVAKRDAYGLKRALLQIAKATGPVDHAELLSMCDDVIHQYADSDLASFNTANLINDLIGTMRDSGFELPASITMLARGLVTLEGTIRMISDQVNIMDVVRTYTADQFSLDEVKQHARSVIGASIDSVEALASLPAKANDTLDMLQKGQVKVEAHMGFDKVFRAELSGSIDHFALAVMAVGLFIGSCVLCLSSLEPQLLGVPVLGIVGFVTGFAIAMYDFFDMRRERKRRK
ncbi:MAG: AarF/UbiB family protein [Eggerthellaceae bacterium]|jgi:ubiquinone biosynthesis protein